MAPIPLSILGYLYALFVICFAILRGTILAAANEDRKDYIVYMGALPKGEYSPSAHHMRMLQEVVSKNYVEQSLIRSYGRSFNGFVANLTQEEQQKLALHEDVVSIFPSKMLQLHTTGSWDFMGFPQTVHRNLSVESDIIIGSLDTGILPKSQSFGDDGFGAIPKKWRGVCKGGKDFKCNKKIIGARFYSFESDAIDFQGHGTHTASIAAGNNVNTSFYELANGTVRGGVPSSRIAVYRVCTRIGCSDADVLAGFDDAIADGVDIITVSLGPAYPIDIEHDAIAIGSFHAVQKGILTVNAAGNDGSKPARIASTAPWLFTVAASTTSRKIIGKAALGNGASLTSRTINTFKLNGTKLPLVYGKDVSRQCDEEQAKDCCCMDEKLVENKIVLCRKFDAVFVGYTKFPLGYLILSDNSTADDVSLISPNALSMLNEKEFQQAESYYSSTKNPQANILKSETIHDSTAPVVASFSSRGPNVVIPDILKPDITAPGMDILAAFSPDRSPSGHGLIDWRSVKYSILSGTSMSCPHVTGAAAYVKSMHPDWSPSAIKSALMTTAWRMNATNTRYGGSEFSYGAGHLDPTKATIPGIVYETSKADYIKMLCNYMNASRATKIFGDNINCNGLIPSKPKDLNYPSMAAIVSKDGGFKIEFPRTVTNVGIAKSTYKAKITSTSKNCNITVVPDILSFTALNEKKSFVVTVAGERVDHMMISASLEWNDGVHIARSPIVIHTGI